MCTSARWNGWKHLSISTTLVMTVLPGINDDQIGEVIQHALQWKCVRGVTLQPVSDVGRQTVEGQTASASR